MPDQSKVIDVAIIGAGVSGAYCAYRLAHDTSLSVEVFEANNRIGGRLWTIQWPDPDTLVELGGEAFSPMHANVAGLVRVLGLRAIPHKEFNTLNRLFLRDRLLRFEDLLKRNSYPGATPPTDPKVRYFLQSNFFTKPDPMPGAPPPDPDAVDDPFTSIAKHIVGWLNKDVGDAFGQLLGAYSDRVKELSASNPASGGGLSDQQALDLMTPGIYDLIGRLITALEKAQINVTPSTAAILKKKQVPIYQFDLWSVAVRNFGQEAYELFRSAGYSNTAAMYFNLLELLENLMLGALFGMASPNFWSLEGGFDSLPKALVAQATGAKVNLELRLTEIVRNEASGLLTLTFKGPDGTVSQRTARKVIMTAPVSRFDSAVGLSGFDSDLTEDFARRRVGVISVPAGKLFLVYPEPWWSGMKDLSATDDPLYGYANTDMPSRAVYYKGLCGDGKRGLVTGALTDGINSDFWTSFLSPDADIYPGTDPAQRRQFGAPTLMVDACHRILNRIHHDGLGNTNLTTVPELALYHEWTEAGGGWSAWRSGRDIHGEAARLRTPFTDDTRDQGLYCCGDSVSERHGWVEDVLESAEDMLSEAFGLGPAKWLPGGEKF
jgi:hypothetical protein